jgi:uncharacterized repeat protein (TIGR01451 family)
LSGVRAAGSLAYMVTVISFGDVPLTGVTVTDPLVIGCER